MIGEKKPAYEMHPKPKKTSESLQKRIYNERESEEPIETTERPKKTLTRI